MTIFGFVCYTVSVIASKFCCKASGQPQTTRQCLSVAMCQSKCIYRTRQQASLGSRVKLTDLCPKSQSAGSFATSNPLVNSKGRIMMLMTRPVTTICQVLCGVTANHNLPPPPPNSPIRRICDSLLFKRPIQESGK